MKKGKGRERKRKETRPHVNELQMAANARLQSL